uniref:DEK-C domain-containing protein n=1 Tax=Heterosigma akashiwo TaxID=2829 RepID=A0A7S4D9R4_HETAK
MPDHEAPVEKVEAEQCPEPQEEEKDQIKTAEPMAQTPSEQPLTTDPPSKSSSKEQTKTQPSQKRGPPVEKPEDSPPAVKKRAEEPSLSSGSSEVTGVSQFGRKRKSVDRMKVAGAKATATEVVAGSGACFADIEAISTNIKKLKPNSPVLKCLHMLAFGKVPKAAQVKGNLLAFSGLQYPAGERAQCRAKLEEKCAKFDLKRVRECLDALAVPRGKQAFGDAAITKDMLCALLLDFLERPSRAATKEPPKKKSAKKRRRSSPKPKKKVSSKKTKATTAKKTTKKKKEEEKEVEEIPSSSEEEEENSGSDSEFEEAPAKKGKSSPAPRKKKAAGKAAAAAAAAAAEDSDLSDSDAEEVHVTDSQLKAFMRDLLKTEDMDTMTLKKVRQACEAHFGVSLEERKADLRELLTSCIQDTQPTPDPDDEDQEEDDKEDIQRNNNDNEEEQENEKENNEVNTTGSKAGGGNGDDDDESTKKEKDIDDTSNQVEEDETSTSVTHEHNSGESAQAAVVSEEDG